jgi:TolA-binding protein
LSGDSNLIGVRSRATMSRPFTVVRAMQLKAEENYRTKIKQLEDALQMTQQKVNELQASKEQGQQRFILSPEQQHELERFRVQETETRRELKALRKNLRRDIDSLENRLKWVNILGMPLIVTITGITLALQHRRRQTASN